MSVRVLAAAGLMTLTLASCSLVHQDSDPDVTVTVVKGIELAPKAMQRAEVPVARLLRDSRVIVYVSSPLYSGSCPPTAEAETDADTVTLTVDTASQTDCTADANRDTFLIQGFRGEPSHLIVKQDGEKDLQLDIAR